MLDTHDKYGRIIWEKSPEPLAYVLRRWAEGASADTIAHELPGTNKNKIIGAIHRNFDGARTADASKGIQPAAPWSQQEIDYLRENASLPSADLAAALPGRSHDSIRHRARAMGLLPPNVRGRSKARPATPPPPPTPLPVIRTSPHRKCQWLEGDHSLLRWCEAPSELGWSYCPDHAAVVYIIAPKKAYQGVARRYD